MVSTLPPDGATGSDPVAVSGDPARMDRWLHTAIGYSAIGTALLEGGGRVVFLNEACAEILGVPADELVGRRLTEFVHPDDRSIDQAALTALHRGDVRSITSEWRPIVPGARSTWVRTHLSAVRDGGRIRYVVQLEDITEQRRLEARLDENRRRANLTLDALEEGVLLTDSSHTIRRINPAAERMLGYTAEELTERWRRRDWETYDENGESLPAERRPLYRASVLGERVSGERVMWRRSTGELIVVRVSCIPTPASAGDEDDSSNIVVTFSDVTEASRTERLLEATFETAPAGLALVDGENGRVLRCNPTFAEQVGRPADALVGQDILELFDHDDASAIRERHAGLVGGSTQVAQFEQVVRRPDGSGVTLHTTLALIDQVEARAVIAATFDITERLEMESALTRFGHLFERTNDLIAVIDLAGTLRYATPSHEHTLGLALDEHRNVNIFDYIHPDDADLCRENVAQLLQGAESAGPFTVRIAHADGDYRVLESVAVNLLDEPSVGGIVFTSRDVTERETLMAKLEHRAAHDLLTELPNRMLYEHRLGAALTRSQRTGERVGLCFVDLDDFKGVNDTLGHQAGDDVLREVARRLRSVTRDGETPARIGGDEFVVVLDPIADVAGAQAAARRIRDALVDPPIVLLDGVRFGASIGVAVSRPDEDADHVQSRADRALYRAKARRNSAIEVSPDPSTP